MISTRQHFIKISIEIEGRMALVINENYRTLYVLDFHRSSHGNEDFLGLKEDESHEQHESII